MTIFLILVGLAILIYVHIDALVTILTVGGGGPLTSRLASGIWYLALRVHGGNRSRHRLLAITGSLMLVMVVLLWFIATWAGWSFVFCAVDKAVVSSTTLVPASNLDRIYFVGYTLSTLGMGNFKPLGFTWQMAVSIASIDGFFLVTLGLAYILSVVTAVAQKRYTA
ncbi:MAG: two pore domain potassium channel family protein, partial [Okeania sp. SIO2D1]|nr:two pore domain potassium channel family protein [Okeania sp. SIO2D1]